jgi:hypothetical protein
MGVARRRLPLSEGGSAQSRRVQSVVWTGRMTGGPTVLIFFSNYPN